MNGPGLSAYLPNLMLLYAAFALAAGVTAGSFTWGVLTAAGVSALISAHAGALQVIKLIGAAYLLFLAWRSARSALNKDAPAGRAGASSSVSLPRLVLRGYLMHLTNPKAILGWMAIISIGLPPQAPWAIIAAILLGCLLISLTSNASYALVFSTPPMVAAYRRARRWIEGVLAGVFVFAGLKLMMTRL